MPIYAYKCSICSFEKDVIQKFSDEPLRICPNCSAEAFARQLTAPAFQLKGTGWYVTDFRDSGQKKAADKPSEQAEGSGAASPAEETTAPKPTADAVAEASSKPNAQASSKPNAQASGKPNAQASGSVAPQSGPSPGSLSSRAPAAPAAAS